MMFFRNRPKRIHDERVGTISNLLLSLLNYFYQSILCWTGTKDNDNSVRLISLLKKTQREPLIYYDRSVLT